MSKIVFDWSNEQECKFTKELLCEDKLERTKYANYLTNYLNSFKNESYVFNLNSEWGSGKTYFIKRWANSIADKHPVVYIDAWKSDSHEDPLLLVLSAVIERLQELLNGGEDEHQNKVNQRQLLEKVVKLAKFAAITGAKSIGLNIDNQSLTDLLAKDKIRQQAITEFRKEVERLLTEVICKQADGEFIDKWSPMYIFIDELDRCRPTFAIELLEVVKHIFDIKKVIFVIATDTEQLQHSIKAVYGEGFDSARYLMRFFQRTFTLPKPSIESFVESHYMKNILLDKMQKDINYRVWKEHSPINIINFIFICFNLDLRTINQIIERVGSVIFNHPNDNCVLWLVFLESLKVVHPAIYINTKNGDLYRGVGAKENDIISSIADANKVKIYFEKHKLEEYDLGFIELIRIFIDILRDPKFPSSFDMEYNKRDTVRHHLYRTLNEDSKRLFDYVDTASHLE